MAKKDLMITIAIFTVMACTYLIPTGFLDVGFDCSKTLFLVVFCLLILLRGRIELSDIIIGGSIIILSLITNNYGFLTFLPLLYLEDVIKEKDIIKRRIIDGKILYVCLAFTVLYSILGIILISVPEGSLLRFARTGIVEPNQSAFSIFLLGVLLLKKNKKIGIATLLFGFLTFSRLYALSVLLLLLSKTKYVKRVIARINEKKWTYLKLNFIAVFILIGLGFLYLFLYHQGVIVPDSQLDNRFSLLDYSNLHRFTVNIMFIYLLAVSPKYYLLFGMSNDVFLDKIHNLASNVFGVHYSGNVPHNLFLSHLKMYGLFSFFELIYTSKYLRMITTKNNFMLFIIIFLTSSLLGCGLYSYWLYLSVTALVVYMKGSLKAGRANP